jgi:hypothetical protein
MRTQWKNATPLTILSSLGMRLGVPAAAAIVLIVRLIGWAFNVTSAQCSCGLLVEQEEEEEEE